MTTSVKRVLLEDIDQVINKSLHSSLLDLLFYFQTLIWCDYCCCTKISWHPFFSDFYLQPSALFITFAARNMLPSCVGIHSWDYSCGHTLDQNLAHPLCSLYSLRSSSRMIHTSSTLLSNTCWDTLTGRVESGGQGRRQQQCAASVWTRNTSSALHHMRTVAATILHIRSRHSSLLESGYLKIELNQNKKINFLFHSIQSNPPSCMTNVQESVDRGFHYL